MELIYLYINDVNRDLNIEINFNPNFTCVRCDNNLVKINKNNVNLIQNYYGNYIRGMNLILGDNGVGKSTIFEAICNKNDKAKVLFVYYESVEDRFYLKKNDSSYVLKFDSNNCFREELLLSNFYKKKCLITNNRNSNHISFVELNKILSSSYLDNIYFYKRKMAKVCFYYGDSTVHINDSYKNDYEYIPMPIIEQVSNYVKDLQDYLVSKLFVDFIKDISRIEVFEDILNLVPPNIAKNYSNAVDNFINSMIGVPVVTKKYNEVPTISLDLTKENLKVMESIELFFDSINDIIKALPIEKNSSFCCRYILPGLSSGEEQLLNNIISIIAKINDIKISKKEPVNQILLCIDEPDNFLHPSWARKYISILVEALNSFSKEKNGSFIFDIIVSSHSPFLVSDFFKERINVIKMNDDRNDATRIVTKGKYGILSNFIDILLNDYFIDLPYGEYSIKKFIDLRNRLHNSEKEINYEEIKAFANIIDDEVLKSIMMEEIEIMQRKNKKYD